MFWCKTTAPLAFHVNMTIFDLFTAIFFVHVPMGYVVLIHSLIATTESMPSFFENMTGGDAERDSSKINRKQIKSKNLRWPFHNILQSDTLIMTFGETKHWEHFDKEQPRKQNETLSHHRKCKMVNSLTNPIMNKWLSSDENNTLE